MIDEYLQDFVLIRSKDYLHPPPPTSSSSFSTQRQPQHGTLTRPPPPPSSSSSSLPCPSSLTRSIAVQTDSTPTTLTTAFPSRLLSLPLEILNSIIEEAALSSMVDDRTSVASLTIDCLRPESGCQPTFDLYPLLMKRFNGVCKSCASVCRLLHALVVPLLWREPFFSASATGLPTFLSLLTQTSRIASPPSLPPLKPFNTYIRVFSPISSSIFPSQPDLLLQCLPLLPNLSTLRFGSASGDLPLRTLRQIALVVPSTIKHLPDVLLHPSEKSGSAVDRLSAILTLASRCVDLEEIDITWGQALGKQLDHFLFMLRLQGLGMEREGGGVRLRGAALRGLALNDQCEVSVGFLEALPEVAPCLTSLHIELGVKLVQGTKGLRSFDVDAFIKRLPYIESFSWTPTCEDVSVVKNLDDILISHPRMKALQLFASDFSHPFITSLALSPTPLPLRCLCICATTDDLSTLLVLRRPWRLRKMAVNVKIYAEMMGGYEGMEEQMKLDLWRKADTETVVRGGKTINWD